MGFGIDFGGTTVKAAPVNTITGQLDAEVVIVPTPSPATPNALCGTLSALLAAFDHASEPIGVTVPGVVRSGVVSTAANIDPAWVGTDADALFTTALERAVHVVNDADAAGLAESAYGAARGHDGLVVVTTLGTGIGSALIHRGVLVPNSELGHLEVGGVDAETWAANSVRVDQRLSYAAWATRLTRYYRMLEALLNPDLFVVGGGVSAGWADFGHLIDVTTPVVPAALRNSAGIVGAALAAERAGG